MGNVGQSANRKRKSWVEEGCRRVQGSIIFDSNRVSGNDFREMRGTNCGCSSVVEHHVANVVVVGSIPITRFLLFGPVTVQSVSPEGKLW